MKVTLGWLISLLLVAGLMLFVSWDWLMDPQSRQHLLVAYAVAAATFVVVFKESTRAFIVKHSRRVRMAGLGLIALGIASFVGFMASATAETSQASAEVAGMIFAYLLLLGMLAVFLPTVIRTDARKWTEPPR
jgi:hypothetical protein